jgi:ATP-dependent RNA helicase DDX27
MLHLRTIESDDEIEPEVEYTDSENGDTLSDVRKRNLQHGKIKSKTKPNNSIVSKTSDFVFEFDDGQYRDVKTDEEDYDEDNEHDESEVSKDAGPVDHVRNMPRADERAVRAELKLEAAKERKKKEEQLLQQPADMDTHVEQNFFETIVTDSSGNRDVMFTQLNLSRPLLRGVEAAGYVTPTPVQARVIPLALAGRDICASAGK